jgi:hypothetical protein
VAVDVVAQREGVTKHSFDASGAERLRLLGIEVVRNEVTGLVPEAQF